MKKFASVIVALAVVLTFAGTSEARGLFFGKHSCGGCGQSYGQSCGRLVKWQAPQPGSVQVQPSGQIQPGGFEIKPPPASPQGVPIPQGDVPSAPMTFQQAHFGSQPIYYGQPQSFGDCSNGQCFKRGRR